jgi:hypothetical protein
MDRIINDNIKTQLRNFSLNKNKKRARNGSSNVWDLNSYTRCLTKYTAEGMWKDIEETIKVINKAEIG